jgi:hypothetical protein
MKSLRKVWFRSGIRAWGLALLAAGAVALSPCLVAQDGGPAGRAVRLSSVNGQVQLSQGNTVLAAQALANTPLFEGTRITTADDGQAEIQFEDGSVARISPNSSLMLGVLQQQGDGTDTELVMNSGLGYFELQGETPSDRIRVRFGDSVVTASGFTVLRINLDNPPGELAVFSGNAHLGGGNLQPLDLHGGESAKMNGANGGEFVVAETIEPNSWDAWNADRDQALTAQEADRTAATASAPNSNNPAWSDLDTNGNWYNVQGQGYVWSPYEAGGAGWDPYGCGSWVWTPRFGYVWVSCYSWGFMPYQMGMWSYYDGFGWGWAPGLGHPWWGGGGWSYNIGRTPFQYQPPHRPRGGPVKPGDGRQTFAGGGHQPYPVVTVNRLRDRVSGGPVRPRNAPLVVSGNPVQPLRPVAPRQRYEGPSSGGVNRPQPAAPGAGGRYVYTPRQDTGGGARPGEGVAPRPSGGPARPVAPPENYSPRPAAPSGGYTPRPSAPSGGYTPRPSAPSGGYSPRPSAPSHAPSGGGAPASRPSGGGGGGGGSHPSGGGGGGGGSHPSGGGGSHPSSGPHR